MYEMYREICRKCESIKMKNPMELWSNNKIFEKNCMTFLLKLFYLKLSYINLYAQPNAKPHQNWPNPFLI